MVGLEAGIDLQQLQEAAPEQARGRDEQQRDGNLERHQPLPACARCRRALPDRPPSASTSRSGVRDSCSEGSKPKVSGVSRPSASANSAVLVSMLT